MSNFRFANGLEAEDMVTGIKGIIISRSDYLNGCIRYCIQPRVGEDNKPATEVEWVDEQQIRVIGPGVTEVMGGQPTAAVGGPQKDAPRF